MTRTTLFWIYFLAIILIGCQTIESPAEQVGTIPEAEPTLPTRFSAPVVETSQETEPTIEIVPATKQDLLETSLPNYLGYVLPEPGRRYPVAEYAELVRLSSDLTEPSICFSIIADWFMETGDFPTMEQFLSWVYLVVDDVRISNYSSVVESNLGGISTYDPDTNELLSRSPPGAPYKLCYVVELNPGIHTVTVFVEKSIDKLESYTWSFEITE